VGSPCGRHYRPAFFEVAHQFLLLGVHGDDRLARRLEPPHVPVDAPELRVAIRMRGPLAGLAIGLEAVPRRRQQLGDQLAADLMAHPPQDGGQLRRTLFAVQRKGDMGSPEAVGSTNASRSVNSVGSLARARFRPPPGRRIRPGAKGCLVFSSWSPR